MRQPPSKLFLGPRIICILYTDPYRKFSCAGIQYKFLGIQIARAGQRPTVIIRGAEPDLVGVTNCYLIVFKEIVFSGGGVQYQQTAECPGCGTGYFDFFQVES
jgi:hypothetical protein